jgi:glycerol-3-phosphate dehydrogenase
MRRDLTALTARTFDLVVIGGGIFGACAAWDAVLRGLSVALVERDDFGAATSANSFKMVHGGIRYVQHADLTRVRESCRERSALLRVAPHLVQPLPIAIPTYGHGKNGRALLACGMWTYDLVTLDRNRGIRDPKRRIPWSRLLSRQEVVSEFPALQRADLTGAGVFLDAQMYNPPRLVLAFLRSAVGAGAVAANYVEAVGLLQDGNRIVGIEARERLGGERFPIRASVVLNATGPWAEHWLRCWLGRPLQRPSTYSRDACFVVRRQSTSAYALAVLGEMRDPDAMLARSTRHLFIVPWRDYSLIGVWHKIRRGDPDGVTLTETELQTFIAEINQAYAGLDLRLDDVLLWQAGLLPFGDNVPGATDLSYGKRSLLIDHAREHGLEGLVTLIGIRYTMGRGDAAKAIDVVARKLSHRGPRPKTDRIPVFGGAIEHFDSAVEDAVRADRFGLTETILRAAVHNHGSEFRRVRAYAEAEPGLAKPLPGSNVLAAQVVHAVREEMAETLTDVVFRRTDLGTGEVPGAATLLAVAELMAGEFGWGRERIRKEVAEVSARYPRWQPRAA